MTTTKLITKSNVINVQFPNNFKVADVSDGIIEKLVERVNAETESMEDYYLECEDAREFVTSFFYGEADTDEVIRETVKLVEELDWLDDNTEFCDKLKAKLIKELKDLRLGGKVLFNTLEPYTSTELGLNYQYSGDTILSQPLGEIEVQLNGDLVDDLDKLNDTDLERVKNQVDAYMSDTELVYTNLNGYSYCLNLDVEAFCLAYSEGEVSFS